MAPEGQQADAVAGDARVVLDSDGTFQVGRLSRQQRRQLMRAETGTRVKRFVGTFSRQQRRWLSRKVAREVDQAAAAAARAMKAGDKDEEKRQGERLQRAIGALS